MLFLFQQIITDHKHWSDFCYSELDALLTLYNLDPAQCYTKQHIDNVPPYLFIYLPSVELAYAIVQRSVLIRAFYQCYTHAATVQQCLNNIPISCTDIQHATHTWSIDIYAYGYSIDVKEQDTIRRQFSGKLKLKGKVERTTPELQLSVHIACDMSQSHLRLPLQQKLLHIYLCRTIYVNETQSYINMKQLIQQMSLSDRPYIGPTSTSTDLAMLMCNYGQVQSHSYIYDPFVGTGSLLLAATALGATVVGTDIDWKSLHGQLRNNDHINKNIYKNFEFYKLQRPELLCIDFSNTNLCSQYTNEIFDAIITDPPYGIRAGAKKAGRDTTKSKPIKAVSKELLQVHIPPLQQYDIEDVMYDLLDTAARTLKINGRLVYLLPATTNFRHSDIPLHSCMKLLYVNEQKLRTNFSRYCITLVKYCAYNNVKMQRRTSDEPIPTYAAVKSDLYELSAEYRQEKQSKIRLPPELDKPLPRKQYIQYRKQKREQENRLKQLQTNENNKQHTNVTSNTMLHYIVDYIKRHNVAITSATALTVLTIAMYLLGHRKR